MRREGVRDARTLGGGDRADDRSVRHFRTGSAGADPGEQIAALQKIKRSLSPAERKLDSRLAVDLRLKSLSTMEVDIAVPARTWIWSRGC